MSADPDAAVSSYEEICSAMGTQPMQQFLAALQSGSRICKLSGFENEEQLYATVSLLPYANLEELDASSLRLSLDAWCALLDACSKCQGLQVLSLKGCALGALSEDAQEKIAAHIGACKVVVLDVSQNGLGDTFLLTLSPLPLVCGGDKLTVLDLSENGITDDGLAVLAGVLEVDGLECPLKQLDVSFNRIHDKGACALASLLASVPLLALELEGNGIGDTGSLALASAVKGALCLQRLNLNHNKFSSQALVGLADALSVSTSTLQELAVAGASGGEDGLAALLKSSSKLQLLDIRGLPMSAAGVDAVCALIASSAALVTMRLDVATKEAAEAVAQALQRSSSLLHLMMGGPVPEHVLSFVAASLSSNTLSKLQQQQVSSPAANSAGARPQRTAPCKLPSQQQQQLWSPKRPASASPGSRSPGILFENRILEPSSAGKQTPPRPASAGLLGRSGTFSSMRSLVRTTTQQARNLATIDPTGLAGLTAGGVAAKAAEVFRRHDSDSSGFLDAEEMMAALQDLGMLEGMEARHLGKFLSNAIREADVDKDGRVSLGEFIKYYERLSRHYSEAARQGRIISRRKPPAVPLDAPSNDHLKRVFRSYCKLRIGQGRQVGASVQHINAAQFNQMCRDAGLLEPHGPLSQCAVDIVFTRCKPPGSRRLSFKEFLEAVASVAEEAGCSFDDVTQGLEVISQSSPPVSPVAGMPGHLEDTDFDAAGPGVVPAAAARGSLASAAQVPRISDFNATGTKVGPLLPGRPGGTRSRCSILAASHDSSLPVGLLPGRFTIGKVSGVSTEERGPSINYGEASTAHSLSPCSFKAARLALSAGLAAASSGAGVRLPAEAAASSQHQQQQPKHGAGTAQGAAVVASSKAKAVIGERLQALESILGARAAPNGLEPGTAAGTEPGDLLSRLLLVEAAVAEHQQQLAAVAGQQEALKEVITRVVESMDSMKREASKDELSKQVGALSSDIGQLKSKGAAANGLAEKLQELERKTEDRQMRAETAIYQVARQVDVLDARLKDEQESSLKALEALLANASPAK